MGQGPTARRATWHNVRQSATQSDARRTQLDTFPRGLISNYLFMMEIMDEDFDDWPGRPFDSREDALEYLQNRHIILAIMEVERDIREFDQSTAILTSRQDHHIDVNVNLELNGELEAMKPGMDEKTHDLVEHYSHFARKVKEDRVEEENIPQAALEYLRFSPTKAKFTAEELDHGRRTASEWAAARQKAADEKVLASYIPYKEEYLKLVSRVAEEARQKKDPFTEMIDNISEYRGLGLVYTGKDLTEMGFLSWAQLPPALRPTVEFPTIDLRGKATGRQFACPICSAPIHVRNPRIAGSVTCLNCQTEFDYEVSSSEKGILYSIANGKPFLR